MRECASDLKAVIKEKEPASADEQKEGVVFFKIDNQVREKVSVSLEKFKGNSFTFYTLSGTFLENINPKSQKITITIEQREPIHFSLAGFREAKETVKAQCADFSDWKEILDKSNTQN